MQPRSCPPCDGQCRQGRDCPAGERESFDWYRLVAGVVGAAWIVCMGIALWTFAWSLGN